MDEERRERRRLAILLAVSVALCLALGVSRVFIQKAHYPSWVWPGHNTYEGFVSIDGYGMRAEVFRDWLVDPDEGGPKLGTHLSSTGHSTAVLIPLLIAALSIPLGSIPVAFIVLSASAYLLQVLLMMRLAAALVPDAPRRAARVAGILVAAHCLSMRTTGNLILDGFTATFGTLAVLLSLRWSERPGVRVALALFLVQLLGAFTKLSYVPLLAAPALVLFFATRTLRWRRTMVAGILFGLLPTLPLILYLHLVPTLSTIFIESGRAVENWHMNATQLREYVLELLLLLQVLPFFVLRRASFHSPAVLGVLAVLACTLVANLAIAPPINPRLYLAPLGLLVAAATPAVLSSVRGKRLTAGLLVYVVLNVLVAVAGIVVLFR